MMMIASAVVGFTFLVVLSSSVVTSLYLPGSAPTQYAPGSPIPFKVDKLSSAKTQLPYSFYYLPYCQPANMTPDAESLGELLKGDVVQNAPFDVRMLVEETCKLLCVKEVSKADLSTLMNAIDDEYMANILADNLPAAMVLESPEKPATTTTKDQGLVQGSSSLIYSVGVPVGVLTKEGKHVFMNHWDFIIKYHKTGVNDDARIVGFEATPLSITQTPVDASSAEVSYNCGGSDLMILDGIIPQSDSGTAKIIYTYSVRFVESPDEWGSRWNTYLYDARREQAEIHWFSIINAVMIVLLLSGIIAMILLRTLLRDIARYNQLDDLEDAQEESGWKLIHGDVFRRPNHSKLLAVCAGTGVQLLCMLLLTLVIAVLGFISPANRGSVVQSGLVLFTFMGVPAGYTSARFNKLFDDTTRSLIVTSMTALLFPGVCFVIFFILNLVLWMQGSSGAVSFGSMVILLLLWFGISLPLVFIGSYYGYKKETISLPVRTNQIPRQVPPSHWLFNPFVSHAITGILPFCAVFTELLFILSSVWQHQFYYLFGFVLLVLIILVVTCAEISIAFTYFQLCSENYLWWWRAYWSSAASAVYVFLYGVFYFYSRLNITKVASVMLYFGYTALMSYCFFLLTGAIGFISTFFFVRAIYGAVKVD